MLGEYLGIDVPSGVKREFRGVGGEPQPFYLHPIKIVVGGLTFQVEAGFSKALDDKPYGIVGQRGFFDLFKITVNLANEDIELLPVD